MKVTCPKCNAALEGTVDELTGLGECMFCGYNACALTVETEGAVLPPEPATESGYRLVRKASKMSVKEVGDHCHLSGPTVNRFERGATLSPATAEYLKMQYEKLFGAEGA